MASSLFLSDYKNEMKKYTACAHIYHQACSYGLLGSLLTRQNFRCTLAGVARPVWTNLWIVILGDSGSYKSTAVDMASEVLLLVDSSIWAPDSGSPEGFLYDLRERGTDPSLVLVRSEFTTLLMNFQKTYSNDFKSVLTDFFDVPLRHTKRLAKNSFTVELPRVSILGAIATESMPTLTQQQDWLGGFFSRCLLIPGRPFKENTPGATVPRSLYIKLAGQLTEMMDVWAANQQKREWVPLAFSSDAEKVLATLPKPPDEENTKVSLARGHLHLKKLAAIEQIDEDPKSKMIRAPAVKRAMEFITYWRTHLPDLVDACFTRGRIDLDGDRLEKRIHRYVLKRGVGVPVTVREILRNCACKGRLVNEAISALVDCGLVTLSSGPKDHDIVTAITAGQAATED